MAEQHGFGRQHAGDAVGAMDAARFARHVGHAHAARLGAAGDGLSSTVDHGRGWRRPSRRTGASGRAADACASSGRFGQQAADAHHLAPARGLQQAAQWSQRLCSQSSGTMPKTSTSSSISPQCRFCQSIGEGLDRHVDARASPAPRSR
jgi:hypothetical protein